MVKAVCWPRASLSSSSNTWMHIKLHSQGPQVWAVGIPSSEDPLPEIIELDYARVDKGIWSVVPNTESIPTVQYALLNPSESRPIKVWHRYNYAFRLWVQSLNQVYEHEV